MGTLATDRATETEERYFEAHRTALGSRDWATAFEALQRALASARSRSARDVEDRALDALRETLRAAGETRRAALIDHYRRDGFRPPLGYD